MDKININLYGGKSIFGGRETPLEAEITYCDRYNQCSFYKQGKCFSAGRWKQNCKFGNKHREIGYTSRAKKYYEFRKKWDNDECKNKLDEPDNIIGQIGNIFVLNTGYLYENEDGGYYIDTHFRQAPLIYVPKDKFTNDLIKLICDAKPRTIFENSEIKSYQEKIVPRFLYELKTEFKEIYDKFIKEYPEYENRKINFIGREAYINTLKNGSELLDCHKNKWRIENNYLVCYEDNTSLHLPFAGGPTEIRIKITDKMTYRITDNEQVTEKTKFAD
jgi:hypothetical protein